MSRSFVLLRKLILLTSILSFHSCNIIRLFNIDESNDETKNEIELFLQKHNYCYDYNLCSTDSTYSSFSDEKNNLYVTSSTFISAIQLRIFDKSGVLYSAYSQCGGDFKKNRNIKEVPPPQNQNPNLNTKLRLIDELALLEITEDERKEIINKSESYPYTFILHYTIWSNYFSENVLADISKLKKKYPEKMLVILVNVARNK
jgi:hypothetical protein